MLKRKLKWVGLGSQVGVGLEAEIGVFGCWNGGWNGCVWMLKWVCLRAEVGGFLYAEMGTSGCWRGGWVGWVWVLKPACSGSEMRAEMGGFRGWEGWVRVLNWVQMGLFGIKKWLFTGNWLLSYCFVVLPGAVWMFKLTIIPSLNLSVCIWIMCFFVCNVNILVCIFIVCEPKTLWHAYR